MSYQATQ